ncbi:ABC transporter substrate-binding protein [Arenibaculum sp.]|jgi:putative ABC transport system substrate-binding protein|uniref:ABC transporter substrate-binding protein n=1 Tax=Arenibaculum sp. TaxID=2865862 RepID=UPI002E160E24|nr:ABC transporter substrate-binding protein [Arenibaculum sp.]
MIRRAAKTVGFALLMLAGSLGHGVVSAQPAPPQEPYKVMMVLWRGCEDACRGFQDYLAGQRIPVDFLVRDVNQDPMRFPNLVAEARALDVDLVMTWGTTATLGMVGQYDHVDPDLHLTDIPVVFMIVTDPVGARVVPDLERSGRNVSGTLVVVPEDVQMRAIQTYRPFKRLGIIYNTDEINAVVSVERVRKTAAETGLTVVTREVPLDANGQPDPDSLPGLVEDLADEVDLFYIGSSSFILVHRDVFTRAALASGVPVAAAGEVPVVESDALMGLVSRYYNVGRLTAAKAEQILVEGKAPEDMPIEALSRFSFIVNMEVAHELKLYPPLGLLRFAEVIKVKQGGAP